MDPLSQAVTGAALTGIFSKNRPIRPALLLGAFGGMAADLDILIRSSADPLASLEYHRHFTHSLAFTPIGGLLVALAFWIFIPWIKRNLTFKQAYLFSFFGYFTHGLLDSCTGYGTHLLWPFSNMRESWNSIGIIDPFFTVPIFFLLVMAAFRQSLDDAKAAALWATAYLALGFWQQERATNITTAWLAEQSIAHDRLTLRPTIGNLWLWRVLYRDNVTNRWQTHALYLPFWSETPSFKRGESARIFSDKFAPNTVMANDIARFAFFSNNYLSRHDRPDGSYIIGDIRYGLTPDSAQPLWGIQLPDEPNHHVKRLNLRGKLNWDRASSLLKGEGFSENSAY